MALEYSVPTPDNLTFLRREILKAKIEPHEGATGLNCYFNARDAVKKHGGSLIDVWEVVEVTGCFLHFRPHVLWRKPEGKVIDPTPSEFGISVTTYFEAPTPHELPMPPGYLHPLTNNPEFIKAIRIQNLAYKMIAEKLIPGKEVKINKQHLFDECSVILKKEGMYSDDNVTLLAKLFVRGK